MRRNPRLTALSYLTPVLLCATPHFAAPLLAQPGLQVVRAGADDGARLHAKLTPNCQGGLVYDDGTVEDARAFALTDSPEQPVVDLVMHFDLPRAGARLEQICVCWTKVSSLDTLAYDLVVYDTDGPGGTPGSLLDRIPVTASGIPEFPVKAFFDYPLTDLDLRPPGEEVFLGVSWRSTENTGPGAQAEFLVCNDENGPGGHPIFVSDAPQVGWQSLNDLEATVDFPLTRSLFVRAETEGGGAPSTCIEDDTTLCLGNGRFEVKAEWRSAGGQGMGMAEPLTTDTGYFWFFHRDNVEMVIKVLDACATSGHYWVFAGGLTNVEVDITVTDTTTGDDSRYHNPIDTPFQPIQDVQAFATCP
jgi:hypothetical protein